MSGMEGKVSTPWQGGNATRVFGKYYFFLSLFLFFSFFLINSAGGAREISRETQRCIIIIPDRLVAVFLRARSTRQPDAAPPPYLSPAPARTSIRGLWIFHWRATCLRRPPTGTVGIAFFFFFFLDFHAAAAAVRGSALIRTWTRTVTTKYIFRMSLRRTRFLSFIYSYLCIFFFFPSVELRQTRKIPPPLPQQIERVKKKKDKIRKHFDRRTDCRKCTVFIIPAGNAYRFHTVTRALVFLISLKTTLLD